MRRAAARRKRRTGGIGVAAALLAVYVAWFGFTAALRVSVPLGVVAAALAATAIGLLYRQAWAKWLAVVSAVIACILWVLLARSLAGAGSLTSHWSQAASFLILTFILIPGWGLIGLRAWKMPTGPQAAPVDVEVFD